MDSTLAGNAPLEVRIGQMLMAGFEGTTLTEDARTLIEDLHVGNVVLLERNVNSPDQLKQLTNDLQVLAQKANGLPLLISADQEGGTVQRLRLGFTRLPSAVTVGESGDPSYARDLARQTAEEMAAVGVNLNLAPVLDVNDNPLNPVIGPRAYGSTPGVVRLFGRAVISGFHDGGILATGKHFPGHGSTSEDSHFSLAVVLKSREELEATELVPFRAAVADGVDVVMAAHVAYPALDPSGLPATISEPILSGLLRREMGFEGIILTDDMGMVGIRNLMTPEEAAVQVVLAGGDVILCARLDQVGSCPPAYLERLRSGLLDAVRTGRISEDRIQASLDRILAAKRKTAIHE